MIRDFVYCNASAMIGISPYTTAKKKPDKAMVYINQSLVLFVQHVGVLLPV